MAGGKPTTRRAFLGGLAGAPALGLVGCETTLLQVPDYTFRRPEFPIEPGYRTPTPVYDAKQLYAELPYEQFPIPAINPGEIPENFHRQLIPFRSMEAPGTIIIDTARFYLYHIERGGMAMRYGVGLGREGFEWSGRGVVGRMSEWPRWHPPEEMIEREPDLEEYRTTFNEDTGAWEGGMDPGLNNPLGSRAIYIYQDGKDTLYRIHGTPQYWTIGKAVSSGCVRMINHDVIDLYRRVHLNSPIIVRAAGRPIAGF